MRAKMLLKDKKGSLIEKLWNEKCKNRNALCWRYHRNKRLEEIHNFELLKGNLNIPRRFFSSYNGKKNLRSKRNNANLKVQALQL